METHVRIFLHDTVDIIAAVMKSLFKFLPAHPSVTFLQQVADSRKDQVISI